MCQLLFSAASVEFSIKKWDQQKVAQIEVVCAVL